VSAVSAAHAALSDRLGAVRIEWVHDGSRVWILQLHRGATDTGGDVLVPGEAAHWFDIGAQQPLAEIRAALESLPEGAGVQIIGDIGLTSHVADVVRKRGRPARLIRANSERRRSLLRKAAGKRRTAAADHGRSLDNQALLIPLGNATMTGQ
jgi:hypothetical protein